MLRDPGVLQTSDANIFKRGREIKCSLGALAPNAEGCLFEPTACAVPSATVLSPVKLFVQCHLRCYAFLAGKLLPPRRR